MDEYDTDRDECGAVFQLGRLHVDGIDVVLPLVALAARVQRGRPHRLPAGAEHVQEVANARCLVRL